MQLPPQLSAATAKGHKPGSTKGGDRESCPYGLIQDARDSYNKDLSRIWNVVYLGSSLETQYQSTDWGWSFRHCLS